MDIRESRHENIVCLEPVGRLDSRAAVEFERSVKDLLGGDVRLFAIDLGKVTLLTSAGIRVLVMLAKRLGGIDGGLVLCGLKAQAATVFEISGLTQHFLVEPSREAAIERLSTLGNVQPAESETPSTISELAMRLLGGGRKDASRTARGREPARRQGNEGLLARVVQLLAVSDPPSIKPATRVDEPESPASGDADSNEPS
jgi:anti-anti-sigma factor